MKQTGPNPFVAAVLSLLLPGVGQLYAGHLGAAGALWSGSAVLALGYRFGLLGRTFTGFALLVGAFLALLLAGSVHAFVAARQSQGPRRWFQRWYVGLAVILLLRGVFDLALGNGQRLQTFQVPAASMAPTLVPGDHVVVALDAFGSAPVPRGAVVVFQSPEKPEPLLIKRVVAVGGDRVEIRDKQLFVNGLPVSEPWIRHDDPRTYRSEPGVPEAAKQRDQLAETTVPAGSVYLLGDNRDHSYDSRFFGPIPLGSVRGRPLYIYWSEDRSRVGRALPPGPPLPERDGPR